MYPFGIFEYPVLLLSVQIFINMATAAKALVLFSIAMHHSVNTNTLLTPSGLEASLGRLHWLDRGPVA